MGDTFGALVAVAGIYQIDWQMSIDEPGQNLLQVDEGAGFLDVTVVGRATGTSQLVGSLIRSTLAGSIYRVVNPAGNPAALTLTPIAGGTRDPAATLNIHRVA